jgi:hypothetical protein
MAAPAWRFRLRTRSTRGAVLHLRWAPPIRLTLSPSGQGRRWSPTRSLPTSARPSPAPNRRGMTPVFDSHRTLGPIQLARQNHFLHARHRPALRLHGTSPFTSAATSPPRRAACTPDSPGATRSGNISARSNRWRRPAGSNSPATNPRTPPPSHAAPRPQSGLRADRDHQRTLVRQIHPVIAAGLPAPHRGEFQRPWNAWLALRPLPNTAALQKTGRGRHVPLGATLAGSTTAQTGLGPSRLERTCAPRG